MEGLLVFTTLRAFEGQYWVEVMARVRHLVEIGDVRMKGWGGHYIN